MSNSLLKRKSKILGLDPHAAGAGKRAAGGDMAGRTRNEGSAADVRGCVDAMLLPDLKLGISAGLMQDLECWGRDNWNSLQKR